MPKRTAAHRGHYKAKSTRKVEMPTLLPGLSAEAAKQPLRQMLARLHSADIANAWQTLDARCAACKPWRIDAGLEVLLALIEALAIAGSPSNARGKDAMRVDDQDFHGHRDR